MVARLPAMECNVFKQQTFGPNGAMLEWTRRENANKCSTKQCVKTDKKISSSFA